MITVAGFNTALDKLVDVDVLRAGTMQRISGVTPENLPAAPNLKKLKSKAKPKGLLDGEA